MAKFRDAHSGVARRLLIATAMVAMVSVLSAAPTFAEGAGPAQLARAGWDCFQPPPDFNPYIHCLPPGELAEVVAGQIRVATLVAFDTTDINATTAGRRGMERMFRSDVYNGQPCPTDPPSYQYSWLFPRFGWDYYICHTFDSPW